MGTCTAAGGATVLGVGVCAAHPDVSAKFACARCGTYGCGRCVVRTTCRECLIKVFDRHRNLDRLVRALGLVFAAQAAWIGGYVFTTLRDPLEATLASAVFAFPLLCLAIGVHRLHPQARILGVITSFLALGLGPIGIVIVALAMYALLPGSRKQLFSQLHVEAREAALGPAAATGIRTPLLVFVIGSVVFVPFQALAPGHGARLSDVHLTLADLLAFGAINAMLCAFSVGPGWMGRARLQLIAWATVGFCGYFYGPLGALWTVILLCVLLFVVGLRQVFPTLSPTREQPVDMSACPDHARFERFLSDHGFAPLTQLSTSFTMGTISESVAIRSDGTICRLEFVAGGNTGVYTPYLETWFADGRSIRSSNQIRWQGANDRERHPLHQRVLGSYEELLDYHRQQVADHERASTALQATDYLRLRRAAYDDCFGSAVQRGVMRVRDGQYRFAARGCLALVWQAFDIVGALATERVW